MSTTVIVIAAVWFAGAIASGIFVRRFKEQRRAAGEEITPLDVFYDPQDPSSVAVVGSAGNGRS